MKHLALLWALACGANSASAEDLAYVNAALRAWLQAIEADAPYLLVDRGEGELRLMHGRALLRRVSLTTDSLGTQPPVQSALEARLQRYRPSSPWRGLVPSPFDWEQNLVTDSSATSALYFASGLLIYASSAWHRPSAMDLQIGVADLRALYNACGPGTTLVVLPANWREGPLP
ncbi:MAG: hypothetical protein F4Z30_16665 [Gemmatimonadetes bacterium]|nr:hypothetical protein [Gemmatimonadota bacterium]